MAARYYTCRALESFSIASALSTVKLEVLGSVHDVSAVAIVESVFDHLVHDDSVQVDDVMQKGRIHRTLDTFLQSADNIMQSFKNRQRTTTIRYAVSLR